MNAFFIVGPFTFISSSTAFATLPNDCIKLADDSRAEMLKYKDGKSDEKTVVSSTKQVSECIDKVDAKGKDQVKKEAIEAWGAFRKMREEKILPVVVRYNQTAQNNKTNLDQTKDALKALGQNAKAAECIEKADAARNALLLYKDGKGDEATVNQTAQSTSTCIDGIDAKEKIQSKKDAVVAWKTFRSIREGKIIPDVKYFMEQSKLNTANLEKTKKALSALN